MREKDIKNMFKAVVFDIGQTLVDYRMPMNWSSLYRPAFVDGDLYIDHVEGRLMDVTEEEDEE